MGAAGLRGVLDDPTAKLTVFAPVDSAIVARIANISCASNDWITVNRCSNASELLGSYSLPYLLLNHVAAGKVGPLRLNKIAQLQTLGGASYAVSTLILLRDGIAAASV